MALEEWPWSGLIRSYLEQRKQHVNYLGVQSATRNIEYGLPQGSVLGHLLFTPMINIPNSIPYCRTILFADDTSVYLTGDNLRTMYGKVNTNLYTLNDWFIVNQVSVKPAIKYIHTLGKYVNVMANGMFLK